MYYVYLCRNVYLVMVCLGSMVGVKDTEMKIDNLEKALDFRCRNQCRLHNWQGFNFLQLKTRSIATFVLTHFIGLCKTEWSVTLFIQAAALFECALLIYYIYIYILCWFFHISIYICFFVHMPTTTIFKD